MSSTTPPTKEPANHSMPTMPVFEKTPIPDFNLHNPLGANKYISTAACLIIGDEVLNGKTKDSNSHYFAQFCFNLGIDLKRIEVIPDDQETIVEAARRLTEQHDWVVSSGGIGPTPDDITYQSMAKAFPNKQQSNPHADADADADAQAEAEAEAEGELEYDQEVIRRMAENLKARQVNTQDITPEMIKARQRMALFPKHNAEIIFPTDQLWVPVIRMVGKLCILPGVPRLFEALLDGLQSYLPLDPNRSRPYRILIHTRLPESNISPYLVQLTNHCKPLNIKVGSYPKWNNGVDVSLIGTDWELLQSLIPTVQQNVDGKLIESGQLGTVQHRHKI